MVNNVAKTGYPGSISVCFVLLSTKSHDAGNISQLLWSVNGTNGINFRMRRDAHRAVPPLPPSEIEKAVASISL